MTSVNIKYKCGDRVLIDHIPPTGGIVTAVFIRGRGRAYEISFTGENGPKSTVCDEVELVASDSGTKLGFRKDSS